MKRALVLTAKDIETEAVKLQLIGPKSYGRTKSGNRYSIWALRSYEDREKEQPELEIALYEAGRGQTNTIVGGPPVIESFKPDIVIYIGCAGGEPGKINIGDIFVATEIWNYEPASVSEGLIVKAKGGRIYPDRVLVDEAKSIAEFELWRKRIPDDLNSGALVKFGALASGEKVIKHTESQTWQFIKSQLSDEIIACETEGQGFLASIVPLKTFGIMIRGISDNLIGKDANGSEHDDANQFKSTAIAAAFACQLIDEIDASLLRRGRNV